MRAGIIWAALLFISQGSLAADSLKPVDPTDYFKEAAATDQEIKALSDALNAPQSRKNLHENSALLDIVAALQFESTQRLELNRVLKLSAEQLKDQYQKATEPIERTEIESILSTLADEAERYATKHKNLVLKYYFLDVLKYLDAEDRKRTESVNPNSSWFVIDKQREAEGFRNSIRAYIKEVIAGNDKTSLPAEFLETNIEITFRDLPVEKVDGNVSYISEKPKKVFTIKIIEPSIDTREALDIVAQEVLGNKDAGGIYFDNPFSASRLDRTTYDLYKWGKNILLRPATCSGFFGP